MDAPTRESPVAEIDGGRIAAQQLVRAGIDTLFAAISREDTSALPCQGSAGRLFLRKFLRVKITPVFIEISRTSVMRNP